MIALKVRLKSDSLSLVITRPKWKRTHERAQGAHKRIERGHNQFLTAVILQPAAAKMKYNCKFVQGTPAQMLY